MTQHLKYSAGSAHRRIAVMRLLSELPEFEADDVLYAKLKLFKARFAHKLKGSQDYRDLIALLAEMAMQKTEPKVQKTQKMVPALEVEPVSTTSRYIPVRIKREAWEEAQGRCSSVHPTTGRRCNSQFALEYDHKIPLALGGKTERQNIRVLCRVHNGLAAIQSSGLQKMECYLYPQVHRSP